jgi:hypothetical protein
MKDTKPTRLSNGNRQGDCQTAGTGTHLKVNLLPCAHPAGHSPGTEDVPKVPSLLSPQANRRLPGLLHLPDSGRPPSSWSLTAQAVDSPSSRRPAWLPSVHMWGWARQPSSSSQSFCHKLA